MSLPGHISAKGQPIEEDLLTDGYLTFSRIGKLLKYSISNPKPCRPLQKQKQNKKTFVYIRSEMLNQLLLDVP